jgi:hypothetical protein
LAAGPLDAIRQLHEKELDLLVVSTLVGEDALLSLRRDLEALEASPRILVVGDLAGEAEWKAWQSPPRRLLLREPFDMDDVIQAVRTLVGPSGVGPVTAPLPSSPRGHEGSAPVNHNS